MTAVAPHRYAPPLDPEALIEEARRRARRRRLAYIAAALAVLAAGAVWAVLAVTRGGATTAPKPPPGFTLVQAKGRVSHALLEYPSVWKSTSLASGQDRPAKVTEEIWYDRRSGLWRDVYRVGGRTRSDQVGISCAASRGQPSCNSLPPLSYLHAFPWPPAKSGLRETGSGTFHGHDVIWLGPRTGLRTPPNFAVSQFGLDSRTHTTVVVRSFAGGRPTGATVISQRPELSPAKVSFVVPKGGPTPGAPSAYEPWSGLTLGYGLPAARSALGRTPLWLGPRYRGHVLRSVTVGTYWLETKAGARLRRAPFVRFYYGDEIGKGYVVSVEEFGSRRPYFYEQGPRSGSVEWDGISTARLARNGLIMRVSSDFRRFRLTRANAIALAKALRPLPAGVNTLPTLRQQ